MSEHRPHLQWAEGAAGPVLAALDRGDDTGWMDFALCAEVDPDLHFPEKGGKGARDAKRVCARCFVRDQCAGYAIADPSLQGIWGGLTEHERKAVRRERAA